MTPEAKLKKYLSLECTKRGWKCLTLNAVNYEGWPDRTILLGNGLVAFIEVKTEEGGKKKDVRTELQRKRVAMLQQAGYNAFFVIERQELDTVLRQLENVVKYQGI